MKYLIKFSLLIIFSITIMCCGGDNKKEAREKTNTTKKENSKKKEAIYDLSNKGIGPIKSLEFSAEIHKEMAKKGATIFKSKCSVCHKPKKKYIGPAIKGIYKKRSPAWVMNMILNPNEMVQKDPVAKALLMEFSGVLMGNQNLTEKEARYLAEYFRTL